MDFELTDEQRLIRETARAFTDNEIVARGARERSQRALRPRAGGRRSPPRATSARSCPGEYGGAGLDYLTYGLIVEEIGRGDSSMRTVISVQTSLVCSAILRWGTEEQKQRYLPKLCSGEWLGCFGLTEPDTGSDAANQRTRAKRTDSGWVINGAKMWISLGNHAKLAMIFAQTDPEKGHQGLACFLVETEGNDGFQPQEIHHKLGLRGSDTASISLSDCEVPEDAMLGEVGDGFKIAMTSLDSGRYSVAAGCVGICQGCVEHSVNYAKERQQFGRPIASFQLVQAMLADMKVETDAARMLVYRAGYLKDTGQAEHHRDLDRQAVRHRGRGQPCANTAIQVHGGSGYVDDHPVERYFRDVRVTTLYEGTSQIQKLIIGRALTGINALVPS